MIFYVSIRPINLDGKRLLTPKYMLNTGFRGLSITWKCIANGNNDDGRWLYEIEADTREYAEVILEGLQLWGAHLKTIESAKALAEKLLYPTNVNIEEDRLKISVASIMPNGIINGQ